MQVINISNTATTETNGSYYQGEVETSYHTLVELFGEPCEDGGYKIQKEWILQFEDGSVATIYDWKWGDAYNGAGQGTHYTNVPVWNINGFNKDVVKYITDIVDHVIVGELVVKQLENIPDDEVEYQNMLEEVIEDAFDTCLNDSNYMRSLLREYFGNMSHDEIRKLHHDAFYYD